MLAVIGDLEEWDDPTGALTINGMMNLQEMKLTH
jgi:hypothetical protein